MEMGFCGQAPTRATLARALARCAPLVVRNDDGIPRTKAAVKTKVH